MGMFDRATVPADVLSVARRVVAEWAAGTDDDRADVFAPTGIDDAAHYRISVLVTHDGWVSPGTRPSVVCVEIDLRIRIDTGHIPGRCATGRMYAGYMTTTAAQNCRGRTRLCWCRSSRRYSSGTRRSYDHEH